jgi:preprotein translocase subunit SecD
MLNSSLRKVVLIFILTLLAAYVCLPKELPVKVSLGPVNINSKIKRASLDVSIGKFKLQRNFDLSLGLDLAGGAYLAFEADTSDLENEEKKVALEAVKSVVEKRVNIFGISEPNVYSSSFEGKNRIVVELPGIHDTKEATELIGQTAQLVFAEVGEEDSPGIMPTDLTGSDLKKAGVVFDQTSGKPAVSLEFTDEGATKFAQLTEKNQGKILPIMLDNNVVSAPLVQEKITGGTAQITGEFTVEQAKNISIQLNAGALPVPISLVEQKTVGATLGTESVEKSIRAGLIGLAMVLTFMVLAYGKLGVISDIALIIFGVLTLAIYKLIPVTLTLPGIAGFLLSVGMAVDSNILIFERFKEEIKRRDFINAMEVSFGRAWDSIRDANIATLAIAIVLANPFDFSFLQTSGPVRGFAITLTVGLGISLFTGILVSRNLLRAFLKQK